MARGDVISDWDVSIAASATATIQPSSGVEWLLTDYIEGNNGGDFDLWGGNSTYCHTSLRGGETGDTFTAHAVYHAKVGHHFATNSEYPRLHNAGVSTRHGAFNGIETK